MALEAAPFQSRNAIRADVRRSAPISGLLRLPRMPIWSRLGAICGIGRFEVKRSRASLYQVNHFPQFGQ